MSRMGVSSSISDGSGLSGKTPRALLRDPNTAVVLVQAAIAPGSPEGERFDVFVRALNASSLDGGTLWTTTLRLGEAQVFGGAQSKSIATARGPIFINPFAQVASGDQSVSRQAGRVLDGGIVTDPFGIEIALLNESHALARSIVSAINTRFPPPLVGRGETARGRKGTSIELTIPDDYRNEPAAFLEIVRHLRTDPRAGEEAARQYVEALKADPTAANDLAWNLEAGGRKAIPFIRTLYDYPEVMPRLAALRAGARLDDALAADHLATLARTGPSAIRPDAIALLGGLDGGPRIDETLRDLLAERDLPLRIAAYEALAARAERAQEARLARLNRGNGPSSPKLSPTYIQELAKMSLPKGMMQGISRRPVAGQFYLDVVGGGESMVYITQQGTPRIVLFGDDLNVRRPLTFSAWGDSLLLQADAGDESLRVYYKPSPNRPSTIQSVSPDLPTLVEFLARSSSPADPRPGLGLSYSQVVGVLHEISKAGGLAAGFATETDRLKAQLLTAIEPIGVRERPETASEREIIVFKAPESTLPATRTDLDPNGVDKPTIVPIVPPATTPKK